MSERHNSRSSFDDAAGPPPTGAGRFRLLSEVVREFWNLAQRARGELAAVDLRHAAALLLVQRFPDVKAPTDLPTAFINVAAFAAASVDRLTVHELRPAIPRLVAETDLHALPSEAPRLLRAPWLAEVGRPHRERLFGDTVSLASYELEGTRYLVGTQYPDGARVARWRPHWTGEDIAAGVVQERSPLIDDVEGHAAWGREAARFAIVLALLLEAESTPVRLRDEEDRKRSKRPATHPHATRGEWVTRRVSLDETRTARASGDAESPDAASASSDGLVEAGVRVRSHLKRQRHGPGNSLTKYIYVESYEARRWVAPIRRIVVHA